MSVILRLGAVNTDMPYSRIVSEEPDNEKPMDLSSGSEELHNSPPQTYPGCFGLPYQDHNYGAPPPPTPPQTPPLITPTVKESVEVKEEIVVTSDIPSQPVLTSPLPEEEQDDVDDPTRCICDFVHDDGYMIQCDKCSVWQHIVCMGLDRDSIPDVYFCEQCHPRSVDRVRAREFQIRKREFLKSLVIKSHDSSTDTDPEEVNNRLKAYGLDSHGNKQKQKMKLKKRKERNNSKTGKRLKIKEMKIEKENTSNEANRKSKLLVKDFSSRNAQIKKDKLSKKIEKMRAERLSKELKEDRFSSDDLREDEKIISTMNTMPTPLVQDENAQIPWDINTFNEWEQSYESARYNQYTTYVQEYLNSTCINGHHNDIADLVTDGLRVQRCRVKALKNKRKGLEASCNIPNGQPVIEVIGKVMTRHQYDKDNFGQRQLSPFVFFYGTVFDLDLVIDASDYGNDARFIRRSCQPNAAVHHVVAGGQAHFIAVATKEIPESCEITIPFDYDFKKWNYCVECACLRNNCPVTRFQKRRLRFQKLQQQHQHGSSPSKKFHKHDKIPKITIRTPVKSPTRSPVKSPVKSPEKLEISTPTPETIHVSPPHMPSPAKMVRRSQVSRQNSTNASTQASSGRVRSLRVPSQTGDDSSVSEPVTAPDSISLRSTESDHLASPDSHSDSAKDTGNTSDTPKPQEKKKMTREERKMEAIMKAFEKMEKRSARKVSQDQTKKDQPKSKEHELVKEKEEKEQKVSRKEKQIGLEDAMKIEEKPDIKVEKVISPVKVETAKEMEVHVDTRVKEEHVEVKEERKGPSLRERDRPPPPPKTKKAKRSGGRRRTRNASGAGNSSMEVTSESTEENSNSAPSQPVSCPVTPAVQFDHEETPPAFRFLKTKRHLMNEWLSEKDSRLGSKHEPLEVSVEDNMFVTCLPSPRNSMDRLRRNSSSSAASAFRERSLSQHSETNAGSAKKRWLRQAMGDGSSESTSGLSSPVLPAPAGVSSSPQALPSPGGSPPIDFVTPLKKRRLARESLSRESGMSESPAPTPVPTATESVAQQATSYFASLSESFENFKNRNGFTFFSPLKPSDMDPDKNNQGLPSEETAGVATCDTSSTEAKPQEMLDQVHGMVDTGGDTEAEDAEEDRVEKEEKDTVSSCADIDCSVSGNTGTAVSECSTDEAISNTEVKSSSEVENFCTTQSEQTCVCDQAKSANSEPDSSDSVCRSSDHVQENVECDSGSASARPVGLAELGAEVDSTDTSTATLVTLENTQCDSCYSEQSVTSHSNVLPGPSSVLDKVCTSSSTHSSPLLTLNSSVTDSTFDHRNNLDRLSLVDSSTDEPHSQASMSVLHADSAITSNFTSGLLMSEHNIAFSAQPLLSLDNEVSNSYGLDSSHININRNILGVNISDPFSVSSNSMSDSVPVQNRHLKFLNENNYSADTTVDSTTQFISPGGASGAVLLGYDSDSMDVTSASETVMETSLDDFRRGSDDSMSGFLEPLSSTSNDASQIPKEKKKVSLQEYLKRKKNKTSTSRSNSCSSSATSPSSATATFAPATSKTAVSSGEKKLSPLKLSNPISLKELDKKLPPLPSLPSLPMFEKMERKEFKSSSDLLSPIFHREKKQEEVRKPMSLSERLRHEFGLDDTADNDNDVDNKTDHLSRGAASNGEGSDVPPPPPPPPQTASKPPKLTNGTSMQIPKSFSSPLLKANEILSGAVSGSQMVPPSAASIGKTLTGALGAVSMVSNNKPQASSLTAPLSNMLTNVKNPQQLQNDLTAQLNAIKAQISKVQKALPGAPAVIDPSVSIGNAPVNGLPSSSNAAQGFESTVNIPQVFDYGHQSNKQYLRQNSQPVNSNKNFHSYKKQTSSSPSFSKLSPRLKASPTGVNHTYSNIQPQNGAGNQGYNNHVSPSWSQKRSSVNHPSNRKPYGKQNSQKF